MRSVLAHRLRVLGPDHPDTLTTRGDLAYWRGQGGDPPAPSSPIGAARLAPKRVEDK